MDIMGYNGGEVIAMKGKECVAIASDLRYGVNFSTHDTNFPKVFEMGQRLYIGLPGLVTDTQTVYERLRFHYNMYELRENKPMEPKTLSAFTSSFLYEHRFGSYFVQPVIAGLSSKGEPFISCLDSIGCEEYNDKFVVAGVCDEQLLGVCETLWTPNLLPDQLFEVTAQSLLSGFDRDAKTGWGAIVHVIEKDKVTSRIAKTRMD